MSNWYPGTVGTHFAGEPIKVSNEQQARKDAMADAETLYMVLVREAHAIGTDYYSEISLRGRDVQTAHEEGSQVSAHARWCDRSFHAAEHAVRAAHAAFRAVPALRGEK